MNRHERRAHKAELRHAYAKRIEYEQPPGTDEGVMMIDAGSTIPQDIKADVSRVASAISFHGLEDGGDCYLRAAIGYRTLTLLGWRPEIRLGGVSFRAGPHPFRDVVAFCGPGNLGQMYGGRFLGHVWLDLDGDAIDFSCGDWPRLYTPDDDGLGPVQWQCQPPSLIWAPEQLFGWQADGTPELGEVWFCPWTGELPEFAYDRARMLATADVFAETIDQNIARMCLVERLRDLRQTPNQYAAKWQHRMRMAPAW